MAKSLSVTETFSFVEICHCCDVPETVVENWLDHGLAPSSSNQSFDLSTLQRFQAAYRLQRDLGLNTPGVVLVLELQDEMTRLRQQLAVLQRHLDER